MRVLLLFCHLHIVFSFEEYIVVCVGERERERKREGVAGPYNVRFFTGGVTNAL